MKATAFLLVTAGVLPAATEAYEIKPAPQALMELTVEKTGLLSGKKHQFTFTGYRGTLTLDRESPERSSASLSIDSGSITCHDTWLSSKDLRKVQEYALKDMLAADRYPNIAFRSTTITKVDGDRYRVLGILTIRDVSKPASLNLSLHFDAGSPIIEGSSTIKLTDFGLKPPTAALGTIGTKNEMTLRFVVVPSKRMESHSGLE